MNTRVRKQGGTFALNKNEPIHNWYSYVEGYSSCLIEHQIRELFSEDIKTVYDPFGGAGTTPLVASQRGIKPYYSESNPFMCQVINTKINCVKRIYEDSKKYEQLISFQLTNDQVQTELSFGNLKWNGFEKFFQNDRLEDILKIKSEIKRIQDDDVRQVLMLILSSILVASSKMVRRGDLRYATEKELNKKPLDIFGLFRAKLDIVIHDIENCGDTIEFYAEKLSEDARDINLDNQIDCVITSPPYLNGTNYIRNTKLELKLNDYLSSEAELPNFHSKGIVAGINNVSKRNGTVEIIPEVQPFIEQLSPVAYDKRIVTMVAAYFFDMNTVISKLQRIMKDNGIFIMDIGDSQFAGIHIPTHEILCRLCTNFGFKKLDEIILRERRSRNGMVLTQRLLKFRLKKDASSREAFLQNAINFINEMPYKVSPYGGRNWGHSWHSLCSYHGKLKPAIAHFLVNNFTKKGDIVLDPLCGVGTIPFEACLQGRTGIGNDLSRLAYIVTKAKLNHCSYTDVMAELARLSHCIENNINEDAANILYEQHKDFGYNKKLIDYFEEKTFREILCAREYFIAKTGITVECAIVFSALLHILHGNRPYALSRTSHPLTPYAPKGDFVYKSVVKHIKDKIDLAYKRNDRINYVNGHAIMGDYKEINLKSQVDAIICSPPFADSMKFYMQNWMRLWLCGWEERDFQNAGSIFLDVKQKKDFGIYDSFFKMCWDALKNEGKVILHLGKTDKIDMAEILSKYACPYFEEIYRGSENVTLLEKHGIKDKGTTVEHQFLFLIKRETIAE